MIAERTCGACAACCVYLKISALGKEALTPCPHLAGDARGYTAGGCAIQDTKPDVCRDYYCMWRLGHGGERDRPDECGIMADTLHNIAGAVECKQLWDGAADAPRGAKAIIRISQSSGRVAMVASYKETRLVRVVGRPL